MPFINPIEILRLQHVEIVNLNADNIKKAKKRLFAEIDLSDEGLFYYNGYQLTKSDCELAIEDLNNKDKKEYYYQLANGLKPLNDYLVTGGDQFFSHFKQESIYRLPDFINFINPFFAENFSRSLLRAFKENNPNQISAILRDQVLFGTQSVNIAYKGVSAEIQDRIEMIEGIRKEIESKESNYTDFTVKETLGIVKEKFPINILNLLPSYFQSQINKIADDINFLGKAILENFYNTQAPLDLLIYLLQLNIESVHRPVFEENLKIIKEKNDERIEQEKNAPVLKKWADVLLQLRIAKKQVDEKAINSSVAVAKILKSINIIELNSLPPFGNEIRNQIGNAMRGLSISFWNTQNDIVDALKLINWALSIEVSENIKQQFEIDLKELQEIKKKQIPAYNAPYLRTTSQKSKAIVTTKGWAAIIAIIIFIIISSIVNSSDNNSPDYSASNTDTTTPTSDSSLSDGNNISPTGHGDTTTTIAANYIPMRMKNGNIPYPTDVIPKYDHNINNNLIIKAEMTDATVKIINSETDRCVRFVFINSGTTYTVRNIPEGKYYLEIEYGENWEVKEGEPKGKGHFASNDMFKTDRSDYDFNKVYNEDGEISIPSYELTLYTTYSPNNSGDYTQPDINSNDNY